MTPENYPHERRSEPEYPIRDYMKGAISGQEFLLQEQDGRAFRAVVAQAEPWVVVVRCRTLPAPPVTRAFAMNGFELGAYPAAELKPMPADRADRLLRRDLFLELVGAISADKEDAMTAADMKAAIFAANRHKRTRTEQEARRRADLEAMYHRVSTEYTGELSLFSRTIDTHT